ncbi:hypothetical protein H5200_15850 [Pseudoalteromonas sp. SG43-7]|uniref:hypothetical protein n=1 Tax=Pseudoalteromonas sp. SG43-7 TaxID=2760966 RepID=UPI0016011D48|nr:hypothetical protein [Pseudoalteromonas sp. SG43-7]MBB1423384.1 hypothetical protein [Pseudoalteromonas sp. SG43-7]
MRLLIFLLALMSAFFVSAAPSLDDRETVPAKEISRGLCYFSSNSPFETSKGDCKDKVAKPPSKYDDPHFQHYEDEVNFTAPSGDSAIKWEIGCSNCGFNGSDFVFSTYGYYVPQSLSYECPPEGNPTFTQKIDENLCYDPNNLPDCPAGYHSKAVSKALGSTECVPKECPSAGTGENLASTPMTGGVPFSGGGMYCNDGCAYSVNAEQISSEKYAVGTSQGVACGDKPYDNKKLADEGDTDGCSVATNGEIDIMSCPNSNPTTPEKDPHNNDDSKVGEDDTPEKPKETCADGDAACNLKNVETQIENSSNKIIDNDNELHNKKIDADTKNTQAILNIMESVDTSILLQTSQDERLHAVTVSKYNQLIDAVNGLDVGGGGGGGNGNGNGTGEGDCEGSASDCVPIEGAEISQETINLEQYADKYDDWLPNAELPSEKCIVLTNGKSICLSFQAFILLFQGISGLLVIGALMHSAKIISGAI